MSFTEFSHYAYRAWAVRDTFSTGPWEAWYEIHTPDQLTLLFGPTKLPQQFPTCEEASAEAERQARWEISHIVGEADGN